MGTKQLVFYVSVLAKAPRKRKELRYEWRFRGDSPSEAAQFLKARIQDCRLRECRNPVMQGWNCSESTYIDEKGESQTLVMRNLFPSTQPTVLNIG